MIEKPFVTYHVNTFNRLPLLRNLLRSFELCNRYDRFEWVIIDYGSTDGTRDFIYDYQKLYQNVSVVLSNEKTYFDVLDTWALKPRSKRFRSHAIFGLQRNVVRQVGRGDVFIDIADDHQFVRSGDWVSDMLNVGHDYGREKISSIIYRGLWHSRINKPNNECEPERISQSGVPYYVAKYKGYDDYHFMFRGMYEKIGPYLEIERETDPQRIQDWQDEKETFDHYRDYLARADALGLKKIFLKFPYVVDFPNDYPLKDLDSSKPIIPLYAPGEMEKLFSHLTRPVSSDEIIQRRPF